MGRRKKEGGVKQRGGREWGEANKSNNSTVDIRYETN